MYRCGCYIRVSSVSQKDNFSVAVQRKRAEEFCLKMGFIPEIYDEQASASTLLREEFSRLLKDVKDGNINAVWCIEFTRLTRDEADAIEIRRLFVKHNIKLFINGVDTDLTSPESVLMFNINSAVASYERLRVIERSIRGRKEWRDKGHLKYSMLLGYDNVYQPDGTKIAVINQQEAESVRLMFELYAEGYSLRKICRKLTEEGYKSKKGGEWNSPQICRQLQKIEYAGYTTDSKGEIIPSKTYEAIIDLELWKKVQSSKRESVAGPIKNIKRGKFQLSNILKCGICGTGYYYNYSLKHQKKETVKYEYYGHYKKTKKSYKCNNRPKSIKITKLEDIVGAIYLETFSDDNEIQKYIEKHRTDLMNEKVNINDSVKRLELQLVDAKKRKTRLIDAVINGVISNGDASEKSVSINNEISNLENLINNKTKDLRYKEENIQKLIDDFAMNTASEFLDLEDWEKRKLYMERITNMTITHQILEVTFITGLTYILDMKNLPEWIMDSMDILKTHRVGKDESVEKVSLV